MQALCTLLEQLKKDEIDKSHYTTECRNLRQNTKITIKKFTEDLLKKANIQEIEKSLCYHHELALPCYLAHLCNDDVDSNAAYNRNHFDIFGSSPKEFFADIVE